MYGKIFESMFTGSMRGSGALAFAVWAYVIAHQRPNGRERETFLVELNPDIIGFLIGESAEDVGKVIEGFCQPDTQSRSKDKDGRKLTQLGSFLYEVVNGAYYDKLKRDCERTEANRIRQEKWRSNNPKPKASKTALQNHYEKRLEEGAPQEELDQIATSGLTEPMEHQEDK